MFNEVLIRIRLEIVLKVNFFKIGRAMSLELEIDIIRQ